MARRSGYKGCMTEVFDSNLKKVNFEQKSAFAGSEYSGMDAARLDAWTQSLTDRHGAPVQPGGEANRQIMDVLQSEKDNKMGETPDWVPKEMRYPKPRVQCASTASNVYRDALRIGRFINSDDSPNYRELTQVLVPRWVDVMKSQGLAREIPRSEIKPGDAVVGMGGDTSGKPGNNDRHVGFVGEYDRRNQRFTAYSNSMGRLEHQILDDRFGHYREQKYYRLYFPKDS